MLRSPRTHLIRTDCRHAGLRTAVDEAHTSMVLSDGGDWATVSATGVTGTAPCRSGDGDACVTNSVRRPSVDSTSTRSETNLLRDTFLRGVQ